MSGRARDRRRRPPGARASSGKEGSAEAPRPAGRSRPGSGAEPGRAREIALEILLRVSEQGAWASRLLESLDEEALDPRDLALVQETVLGVLRWRGRIDHHLAALCKRTLASLEPRVRESLRLGAYQILFLDRVPDHAAVNGSVELVRRTEGPGAASLVNAVLRRLAGERGLSRPQPEARQGSTAPGPDELAPEGAGSSEGPLAPSAALAGSSEGPLASAPGRAGSSEGALASSAALAGSSEGPLASAPGRAGLLEGPLLALLPPLSRTRPRLSRQLASELSHPEWMVARALERWGEEETRAWLFANNTPPPLTLRPNPLHPAFGRLDHDLLAEGVRTEPGRLAPGARRVVAGRPVRTRLFAAGAFWIQDEASQIVPLLFPPPWTGVSADLCAAPGGKSLVLATGSLDARASDISGLALNPVVAPGAHSAQGAVRSGGEASPEPRLESSSTPRHRVVAFDRHLHRLRRLVASAGRIAPGLIAAVAADLALAPAAAEGVFERVLVDAPCSGTGVLRRHPEIRWRLDPRHLPELAALQGRLLDSGYGLLRPGGYLVYSVCSVEPEEGEEVLEAFLARSGGRRIDPRPHLGQAASAALDFLGCLRTLPQRHGCDAFFAALVRKPGTIG